MSDLKEKVKKALLAEADVSFGISNYSYVNPDETLEEAKRKKKAEKREESESSEKSGTSESSTPECSKSEYETTLKEEEVLDIKLSAKSLRSLVVASIAETMVNESIDEDEDLLTHGLLVEGKLTLRGRELLKKYLPTLFAS
jgi:hypothetical protein